MIARQFATLLALLSIPATVLFAQDTAGQQKTVGVVALAGYDRLMEDVDFLGELGGRPATADMVEGMLAFFTGGRGLEGLDKSRPIGLVVRTNGAEFSVIAALPIPDLDPFLELAENFGLEPLDAGDGVYEIETPEQTVFVKQSGDWTYASQAKEGLATLPSDPSAPLKKLVGDYDIGATVLAANIPEMYREIALEQLRQGMEDGLEQLEGESDEVYQERRQLAESQIEQLSDLIEGLDRITLGVSIDSEDRQLFVDAKVTGKPDSDLALAMNVYNDSTSGVSGFHRADAAASLLATGTTPSELLEKQRPQIEASVEMIRKQMDKILIKAQEQAEEAAQDAGASPEEIEDYKLLTEEMFPAFDKLVDVYGEILLSGRAEVAGSLELDTSGYDLIAGAYAPDPTKVEQALRQIKESYEKKPADFAQIEWELETYGEVNLHGLTLTPPKEEKLAEVMGESILIIFGIGKSHVYLGLGPNCIDSLKKAIDDSAELAGKQIKPAELILSLEQILMAAEKVADEPQAAAVMGMMLDGLEEAPEGADHVVFTVDGIENGGRFRYLLEEGVLTAIGKAAAAAAAQAQAQQAQPAF